MFGLQNEKGYKMKYISTRGLAPALTFEEAMLTGLALDGGLYVPEYIPKLTKDQILSMQGLSYQEIANRNGVSTSLNWQATEHVNLETYISSDLGHGKTKENSTLPADENDYQVGLQVRWTGQPVKFKKNNVKKNLLTQMTQPVRRKYDVLLERSSGTFINRARGI